MSKSADKASSAEALTSRLPSSAAVRETIESVAIAIILAFMVRTFEAEAFVIPTGSMAPTLQGSHKDTYCPQCGYNYRAGASTENEEEAGFLPPRDPKERRKPVPVVSCVCPLCGFTNDNIATETTYNGDRIIVSKLAYELQDPERWDVIVFRYPGDGKVNYIKRLIGLPHETVRIQRGDIYIQRHEGHPAGTSDFEIVRKSPRKLRAMMQEVDDNQYVARELSDNGWPLRWQIESAPSAKGSWTTSVESADGRRGQQRFEFDGSEPNRTEWLGYQHYVYDGAWPSRRYDEREAVKLKPKRIEDFYAYNASKTGWHGPDALGRDGDGGPWVGDLVIDCDVAVESEGGKLALRLVKAGHLFQCAIDFASGAATMTIDEGRGPFDSDGPEPVYRLTAQTVVHGPGNHRLSFGNVDEKLYLWVDETPVEFPSPTTYPPLDNQVPTDDDLRPVRVGASGVKLKVERLRVFRDVYYVAARGTSTGTVVEDPPHGKVEFTMQADQFFVLGDNSPASKDGRLWAAKPEFLPHFVDRRLLIGKAIYIYWPHGRDDVIPFFPFFPNFGRMGFVR